MLEYDLQDNTTALTLSMINRQINPLTTRMSFKVHHRV